MSKLKLECRKVKRKDQRPTFVDINKLKNPQVTKTFMTEVRNRYTVLTEEKDMDTQDDLNDVLLDTGKHLFGTKKRKIEEWISDETWQKVEERKKKDILSTRSEWNIWYEVPVTRQRGKERCQRRYKWKCYRADSRGSKNIRFDAKTCKSYIILQNTDRNKCTMCTFQSSR